VEHGRLPQADPRGAEYQEREPRNQDQPEPDHRPAKHDRQQGRGNPAERMLPPEEQREQRNPDGCRDVSAVDLHRRSLAGRPGSSKLVLLVPEGAFTTRSPEPIKGRRGRAERAWSRGGRPKAAHPGRAVRPRPVRHLDPFHRDRSTTSGVMPSCRANRCTGSAHRVDRTVGRQIEGRSAPGRTRTPNTNAASWTGISRWAEVPAPLPRAKPPTAYVAGQWSPILPVYCWPYRFVLRALDRRGGRGAGERMALHDEAWVAERQRV
jgi:hypothetical protein